MIGPFDYARSATDFHRETFRPLLEVMNASVGPLIGPVTLVPKRLEQMPVYGKVDGEWKHAYGVWKGYVPRNNRREVWYWEDLDSYGRQPGTGLAIKTMAHEVMHVVRGDSIGKSEKADILGLVEPFPSSWHDTVIDGKDYGYFASIEEVFAVYGSAAMVDFTDIGLGTDQPAFTTLYVPKIAEANWPKLRNIIL